MEHLYLCESTGRSPTVFYLFDCLYCSFNCINIIVGRPGTLDGRYFFENWRFDWKCHPPRPETTPKTSVFVVSTPPGGGDRLGRYKRNAPTWLHHRRCALLPCLLFARGHTSTWIWVCHSLLCDCFERGSGGALKRWTIQCIRALVLRFGLDGNLVCFGHLVIDRGSSRLILPFLCHSHSRRFWPV